MGKILLDSNVVIAFLEPENENHEASRSALLDTENIYHLSSLSIAECLIVAFRAGYEFAIQSLLRIKQLVAAILVLSEEIAISAAQFGAELNVQLADAVILATADFHDLDLWTFDKRLSRKGPRIRYLLEDW